MNTEITAGIALVLALAIGLLLIPIGSRINAWEQANGYPFGKLCDLYRNCEAVVASPFQPVKAGNR